MDAYKQIIGNGFLALLGMIYLAYNTQYSLGRPAQPGPGIFPLIVGSVVVLLASAQMIQAFWRWQKAKTNRAINKQMPAQGEAVDERRPWFMALIIAAYILLLNLLGFYVCTFFLVAASSKLIGARDWIRPMALAIGVLIFCYLLFDMWLRLPLPRGYLF